MTALCHAVRQRNALVPCATGPFINVLKQMAVNCLQMHGVKWPFGPCPREKSNSRF
jgi:hypothetical protein